jgi:uncharacterized protein YjiS (DUF1127 family)
MTAILMVSSRCGATNGLWRRQAGRTLANGTLASAAPAPAAPEGRGPMKRPGPDDPIPAATGTAMTGAHLVPVCRTAPSRRTAFGGAVLLTALSLATVLLRHWQRRNAERLLRTRLSELGNHLLQDIGLTRADVVFGKIATLAQRHQSHR